MITMKEIRATTMQRRLAAQRLMRAAANLRGHLQEQEQEPDAGHTADRSRLVSTRKAPSVIAPA